MMQYPESAPKIDWSYYKSKVPIPAMVDEFQKQYSALTIPYPPDTVKPQLDALETEINNSIAKFKSESESRIAE